MSREQRLRSLRGVLWAAALIAALLVAPLALGQGAASVRGTVSDMDGAPLPGVMVKLIHFASGKSYGAISGQDGKYIVSDLPAGEFRLVASLDGHADYDVSLTLDAGGVAEQDFTLYPGDVTTEITVTAARGQRPVDELPLVVSVLTSKDIEKRRPASPQEAYETVPNMRTVGQDIHRARPNLRGLSGSRVLVLLDGERLNNSRMSPGSDGISPSMIDVNQIDSIEVVGGASSSLYGTDAIGGMINIITKVPYRPQEGAHQSVRLDFDYRTGSDLFKPSVAFEYGRGKWATRASYSYFDTGSWESGGRNINPSVIMPMADFALDVSRVTGDEASVAQRFAFYNQRAGDNIPYGAGKGFNAQADVWYYPTENQQLRLRYLTSQHENLELAFRGPPTDRLFQQNRYRDMYKISLGYEGTWLTEWLPKFSANVYRQTFHRAAEDANHIINQGSSWDQRDSNGDGTLDEYYFTGGLSEFSQTSQNVGFMDIETTGANVQAQFEPWKNAILTTGVAYLKDQVTDRRLEQGVSVVDGSITSSQNVVSIPNSEYENTGVFAQLEWKLAEWLRLTAGTRWDNWSSLASPTPGWPAGSTAATLAFYADAIRANPGELDVAGLSAVLDDAGQRPLTTDRDVTTSNIGLTFLLPGGFNPYIRWAESYREPDMSGRYLLRDFGSPFFAFPVVPNTNLKPEEGENLDIGLKINRDRWHAQVGYFKNDLTNFISFASGFYMDFTAPSGIAPFAFFFQAQNLAKAQIEGYEALFEASVPLGRAGSLTPSFSLSWIEGRNEDPSADDLAIIDSFYNRGDTFVTFTGSKNDVPLGGMVPFQANGALRYTAPRGNWWLEYAIRYVDDINRVDPAVLTDAETGQFGPLMSLLGYTRHSMRYGYNFRRAPLSLNVGIENLFDELYFDPFQLAPGRGRTLMIGLTYDYNNDR